jgi:ERCC4-type nuclease
MTFENIFSKEKTKEKTKPKIIIDYREKNSLVPSELKKLKHELKIKELKVGDYETNGVIIERKTTQDFLSSMVNKRLFSQLNDLNQTKNKLLILEGEDIYEINNINNNAIRGFILSIILKFQIPIVYSKNPEDTAKFISTIANKTEKTETSLHLTKKSLTKNQQLQFILESFPDIGPKTIKILLKEFKTIKNIFDQPIEKLKKIIGKKAESFEIIYQEYLEE